MAKILFRFWVRRLLFTFAAAMVLLFGMHYVREGFSLDALMNTWVIALGVSAASASLSTFIAYIRANKALHQPEDK